MKARSRRETEGPQETRDRVCSPESLAYDPKPDDLDGGRVKRVERLVEARRGVDVQIAPMTSV